MLRALDSLALWVTVAIFLIGVTFSAALSMRVTLAFDVLGELGHLLHFHVDVVSGHVTEGFLCAVQLLRAQFYGELDLE